MLLSTLGTQDDPPQRVPRPAHTGGTLPTPTPGSEALESLALALSGLVSSETSGRLELAGVVRGAPSPQA